jgi:hypothetical protein
MSFDCYDARSFRRQRVKEVAIALGLVTAVSLVAIFAHPAKAEARPRHHHYADANGNDPRPSRWCGWWMRQMLGVKDKAGNLARWWASFGSPAHGPAIGVVVVWRHHVGIITGHSGDGWIVKSGNDGHAVRERERSLRGVIAYRWPHGRFALN